MSINNIPFNFNKRKFHTLTIHPINGNKPISTRKIFIDNKLVNDQHTKKRIQLIGIPPAYIKNGAVVAKSPDNDIQAMGINDKKQVQYIYHPKFIKQQTRKKYNDVINLGQIIPQIEFNIQKQIIQIAKKSHLEKDDMLAIILYMLIKYHFRIGNLKYSTINKSFGITTLKPEHIHIHEYPNFEIKFIGKKGILNHVNDKNTSMWHILKKMSNKYNTSGFIFESKYDGLITPLMVNEYLMLNYNTYITPKMFRTWYANYHLLDYLQHHKNNLEKISIRERNNYINDAIRYVSIKLNNTPNTSKKAYVSNKLFNIILQNPQLFIKKIPPKNIHQYLTKIMRNIK